MNFFEAFESVIKNGAVATRRGGAARMEYIIAPGIADGRLLMVPVSGPSPDDTVATDWGLMFPATADREV